MKRPMTRLLLAGSGALMGIIGTAMLVTTEAFLALSDVPIDPDPGLLSELKAPSLLLIVTGALMLTSSVRIRYADVGLTVGALVYGSYGLARLLGVIIDGFPTGSLVIAMVVELVLGGLLMGGRLARRGAQTPRPVVQRMSHNDL